MDSKPDEKERSVDERRTLKRQPAITEEARIEDKIDRDLADSFPASDPPGWTMGVGKRHRNKTAPDKKEANMSNQNGLDEGLSSKVEFEFPDFTKLPERVREMLESLPTKVNFFRTLEYSPGTFVEVIDLTNAIFKNLTLSDYHKELLVLLVAVHEGADYEWEQHVSVAQAAGVRADQFIAIAENRLDDTHAFVEKERILLHFGKAILEEGKAPGIVFKHALEHFSLEELADAMIVIGFYRMLSGFIQTFDLPPDPQEDGNWVKG